MAYISKIKVPGVESTVYLIKDSEGRLMIAPEYVSGKTYSAGDYYVKEDVNGGKLYVVRTTESGTTGIETTVSAELQSIKQSIAGAMHYIGVTDTPLTDGAKKEDFPTLVPHSEGSLTKTSGFVAGDVVLAPASDKTAEKYYEYVFNGDVWSEFGSTKPIGQMAYANTATGSTTITYNKSNYTGGTVKLNEYSEGDSKWLEPTSVISGLYGGIGDSAATVSRVSKNDKYLVTQNIELISGDSTSYAVTDITSTTKRLNTTTAWMPGETLASAVTDITTTQKGLATTEIYGVESKGVNIPVVTRTGTTAPASGSNPFVGAQVDPETECLSWIEEPIESTEITGIAKVASNSITVATGALDDNKTGIITGVTSKSGYGFGKNFSSFSVATGEISDNGFGGTILTDISYDSEVFAKRADMSIDVATGELSDYGSGANIADAIYIEDVEGVVTNLEFETVDVLRDRDGIPGDSSAVKVLTGITSVEVTKDVTLTKGEDIKDSVDVTITVHPDTGSEPGTGPENPDPEPKYLTMTLPEGSPTTQISINKNGEPIGTNIQYRVNNGEWSDWNFTDSQAISANANDVIQWKGVNPNGLSKDYSNYIYFDIPNEVNLSGNVMSLIDGIGNTKDIPFGNCFRCLFENTKIKTVSKDFLPATTLANACYYGMFRGCTSLENAPELPASTLAEYCYGDMFCDCSFLVNAPELPASTLAEGCYDNMFSGCTSLTTAPSLTAKTLAESCYESMFQGCTTLTTANELPATTLASSCYKSMFQGCTSLATAPALPATKIAQECYNSMFNGCTSLTTVPEILPAATLADYCYLSMFQGCTSLTTAPELPATTLTYMCYKYMFDGCTKLQKVTCLATDMTAYYCTDKWLYDVASKGTFVKASGFNGWSSGSSSGIPSGWTVIEQS